MHEEQDYKSEVMLSTKKNYETYNRSERKQVFASNSKFQIESVKIEPKFALMQDILIRSLTYLNS